MRINSKARQYLLIQQTLRIARNVAAHEAAAQDAPDYFSHAARGIWGRDTLQNQRNKA